MGIEKGGRYVPISRQRRERSRKKGNRFIGLLIVALILMLGGGGWYWFQVILPERESLIETQEMEALSQRLQEGVGQLTEWSTEETLQRYQTELDRLSQRIGSRDPVVAQLQEKVDALWDARHKRRARFEALRSEIEAFPPEATAEQAQAMDERVTQAISELERSLGDTLRAEWTERRQEIAIPKNGTVGELTVLSEPSEANAYLDGKLLAKTPFTVKQVRSGTHELLLKKEGYRDRKVSIEVDGSKNVDLGIQVMEPIVGTVLIEVNGGKPKDKIEVEIQEYSGSSGTGGIEMLAGYQFFEGRSHRIEALRIGRYTLIVARNGKEVERREFSLSEGDTLELNIAL